MIASLTDAWEWYRSARMLTQTIKRFGEKYWDDLPWEGRLGRDNRLRHLDPTELCSRSSLVLNDLDDLCVLLLFSVFEANVRELVQLHIDLELPPVVHHPALKLALLELKSSIENGSFFRVLEPYKQIAPDLLEEVNQVRRFRKWVAHGRRGPQPTAVDPKAAYDRLSRFLTQLTAATVPEKN